MTALNFSKRSKSFVIAMLFSMCTIGSFAQTNGQGTGIVTVSPVGNSCLALNATAGNNVDNWEVAEGGTYTMTISNVTECSGTEIVAFIQSSESGNFCVTLTGGGGTYSGDFTLPGHACYTMPVSYKCSGDCSNSDTYNGNGPSSGDQEVHLRMAFFDGDCNWTAKDEDCNTETFNDPVISCPGNNITQCDDGSNIITFEVTAANDGCDGVPVVTQTAGLPSGSSFPVGTTVNTFVATDDCGGSATCSFTVTINPSPTITITPSTTDPVCDGQCVTLTASGADSYVWSTGDEGNSIEACVEGDYSVTGTDANGCTGTSADFHLNVNPNPSCDIIEPTVYPVFGLGGNPLSATVDCPEGCNCNYQWGVTSADGSWYIQTTNGTNITYYCGNNGTTGHFTLTVTCAETGCSSICNLDVTSLAQEHCAYTQGFYGNTNGTPTCLGLQAVQAINQALNVPSCNPIVLGYGTRTLTFNCTDASCINSKLPAGSTPAVLPSSATCSTATGTTWLANGRFKNALVGQALTLAINLRLFPNLGNLRITSATFTTYEATACVNGNAVPGTGLTFTIPQTVISCLGTANKVSDLLVFANKRLGNQSTCTSASLGDITAALDAVNRGFDKCRLNSTSTIRLAQSEAAAAENSFQLIAYPNPASGMTTIEFVAESGNHASVNVYGLDGSLVANLLNDNVPQGATARVNFDASSWAPGIYFVNVTVGDKAAISKLVIMK